VPGGPLNLNSTNLPKTWSQRKFAPFRKKSHGRAGNRTRDLNINSQRLVAVFVALGIQHAMRIRLIVICGPIRSTIRFLHSLITARFWGEKLLSTKCVFSFSLQLLSKTFLILRRSERDMIKNVHRSSCKGPRYSCHIITKPEFSQQFFREILKYQIS